MTQLDRLKLKIPTEPSDLVLEDVLENAKNIILNRRFPYRDFPTRDATDEMGNVTQETYIEPRYYEVQIEIAAILYAKRGGYGETSHTENGVSRTWGSDFVPKSLLEQIIPCAEVVR